VLGFAAARIGVILGILQDNPGIIIAVGFLVAAGVWFVVEALRQRSLTPKATLGIHAAARNARKLEEERDFWMAHALTPHTTANLSVKLHQSEERVRQLEAGLEKYGMHMSRCDWHRSEVCDCGLGALLASSVATEEA
jgi:hypothetical protein